MSPAKPPNDPPWCAKLSHDDSEIGLHRSRALRAGTPGRFNGRGEVTAWLEQGGTGPTLLAVSVAHMSSATVEIDLDEAERLRENLDVLIRLGRADQV